MDCALESRMRCREQLRSSRCRSGVGSVLVGEEAQVAARSQHWWWQIRRRWGRLSKKGPGDCWLGLSKC